MLTFCSKDTFCVIMLNKFKLHNFICTVPVIALLLTRNDTKQEIAKVLSLLNKLKFNKVVIPDTIDLTGVKKKYEGKSYIYAFNYFTKIKSSDFGIPIL